MLSRSALLARRLRKGLQGAEPVAVPVRPAGALGVGEVPPPRGAGPAGEDVELVGGHSLRAQRQGDHLRRLAGGTVLAGGAGSGAGGPAGSRLSLEGGQLVPVPP